MKRPITSQALRVIALGQFAEPIPPLAPRLAALNVAPLRIASIEKMPGRLDDHDVLLTELNWLNALPADQRDALTRKAASTAGWIVLTDMSARFKDQVAWQRLGVDHFFHKPLDPERLAVMVENIHDRLAGAPIRVILLDDEESSLSYYGDVLNHAGIRVFATQDPLLVIESLDAHKPDVLVLDIEMPGCRGPELATIVRQYPDYARLPVIFLTAMESMQDKLLARAAAAEDFLAKPVVPELLLAAVESHALRYRAFLRGEMFNRRQQSQAWLRLEQLRQAIDEHAIVSIANAKGNITYANDKFCAISGFSRDELLGQSHRMVQSGLHEAVFYEKFWRTIESGGIWRGELCDRCKGGGLYWVEATIYPVIDEAGAPRQYIAICTDITALKQKEGLLIAAREVADRANQAKSDFLSSMSHELRTPMNAIIGFAQMLEYDRQMTADQQDNVHEILKAGHHLLELINEVLDLAKIESGRVDLSMEGIDLAALGEDCRQLIQPLADKTGLALAVEIVPDSVVFADRVRLKQVLLNLLSNAIKYNRPNGRVRLTVAGAAADRLRIAVADTGAGVAPERIDELFQPFKRLGAEAGEIEGTGIGLTITRRLVEMMGGEMGVDSTPGVGSTFWLELATGRTAKVGAGKAAGEGNAAAESGRRDVSVLAIDDNPANLKLIAQVMGMRERVHLVSAHTPELGIELALAHRPDLILLDINMPGMDGYQVLDVFKASAQLRHTPVIAITANAMPRDIERGMAAGFADYLTKPLDIGHFLEVVDARLNGIATPPPEQP